MLAGKVPDVLSDDMGKHMGSDREVEACLYELGLK